MKLAKLTSLIDYIYKEFSYSFKNKEFLIEAFTHKSISKKNYERYEFLGDAVLRLSITQKIYQMYPDSNEGELSREVQKIISKESLAASDTAQKLLEFLNYKDLKLNKSSSLTKSLSADLMESLIGAIFVDSDFKQVDSIILKIHDHLLQRKDIIGEKDPKTKLQEFAQSKNLPLPKYSTEKLSGPPHSPGFYVTCVIEAYSEEVKTLCSTVQDGQQKTAEILLKKLKNEE